MRCYVFLYLNIFWSYLFLQQNAYFANAHQWLDAIFQDVDHVTFWLLFCTIFIWRNITLRSGNADDRLKEWQHDLTTSPRSPIVLDFKTDSRPLEMCRRERVFDVLLSPCWFLLLTLAFVPATSLRLNVLVESASGRKPANIVSNLPSLIVSQCVSPCVGFVLIVHSNVSVFRVNIHSYVLII